MTQSLIMPPAMRKEVYRVFKDQSMNTTSKLIYAVISAIPEVQSVPRMALLSIEVHRILDEGLKDGSVVDEKIDVVIEGLKTLTKTNNRGALWGLLDLMLNNQAFMDKYLVDVVDKTNTLDTMFLKVTQLPIIKVAEVALPLVFPKKFCDKVLKVAAKWGAKEEVELHDSPGLRNDALNKMCLNMEDSVETLEEGAGIALTILEYSRRCLLKDYDAALKLLATEDGNPIAKFLNMLGSLVSSPDKDVPAGTSSESTAEKDASDKAVDPEPRTFSTGLGLPSIKLPGNIKIN
jgi:hypothetical protein